MQLLPIKRILNLHPPKSKVCTNELFYSRRLSYFLCHCSHSNITLGSNTSCRELTRNSQTCKKQNRENTRQRKIITCTRQYLCGLAICLHSWSCRDFTKTMVSISCAQDSQETQASAPWTKPQKSLIKKPHNIILVLVVIQIKHN